MSSRDALENWAREHAEDLGLNRDRIEVRDVVNPSGWYAHVGCAVSDGTSTLHVKLSTDNDELRQTYELRDTLVSRYRCPPILGWVDLGDIAGIVTPFIRSRPGTDALIPGVMALASELHADGDLAGLLQEDDQPDSMREAFADIWIERFTTDLDELEAEDKVPPFVPASLMEWMRRETGKLVDLTSEASFDEPPAGPVHGDLHLGNVLVEPDGNWWLLDWDDLHCGDSAADLAMLLLPLIERGDDVERLLGERDRAFLERFSVCARACLLDLVIDSLADWADADRSPGLADAIRLSKRTTHERGLTIYRDRYG